MVILAFSLLQAWGVIYALSDRDVLIPDLSQVPAETIQPQPPLDSRLIGKNDRLFFLPFAWKAYLAGLISQF